MKARVIDNEAVDVCENPSDIYHPDIAALFVTVPVSVKVGWRLDPEKKKWNPPVGVSALPESRPRPLLVVTAIVADAEHLSTTVLSGLSEVTCPAGTVLTVSAELRGPDGSVLPLSDSFRMPIRSRDGREKVLLATMENGAVSISAPMRESGVWSVTEAAINESLPQDFQMGFAGIGVFVVEA